MGQRELQEVFQGAYTEGRDAIAELVDRYEQSGDRRGDGRHAFLAETNDERQHCRASQTGERENGESGQRAACGNERNEEEGHANDSGEDFENNSFGHPPVDRGEEQASAGDGTPEEREGEGCRGGGVCECAGHEDRRPIAVHCFANSIEQGGGGEGRKDRRQSAGGFIIGWRTCRNGERHGENQESCAKDGDENWQSPPESEADENGDEGRRQRCAEAEEGVEREEGAVGGFWKKRGGAGVDDRNGEAEGQAHAGCCQK